MILHLLKSAWRYYRDKSLILKMTVGFLLGLVVAFVFGEQAAVLAPVGDLLLRLLKMIVMPVIVITLIDAICNAQSGSAARIGFSALVYYILTTVAAVVISLVIAMPVAPGTGLTLPHANTKAPESPSFTDQILGIVPNNIFHALANGDILALIFVALISGIALAHMCRSQDEHVSELGDLLRRFVAATRAIIFRILDGILQYAPVGVFALVAVKIGNQGTEALVALAKLTGVVYVAIGAQILLVYMPLLLLYRVAIMRFFRNSREAMMTAFTTQSSSGTIPVTLGCARRAGLLDDVASLVIPVGATVNMDGAVIRLGASVVFAANIVGQSMGFADLASIVLTATLISIGTAGVPGAGLIGLTVLLTQAGLPLDIVALIAGVDVILGMGATMLNVTSDLAGAHIIDQREIAIRNKRATRQT